MYGQINENNNNNNKHNIIINTFISPCKMLNCLWILNIISVLFIF